jgi:hypothetical protein
MDNNMEFGVVDQDIKEVDKEEELAKEYFARMCFIIGQSTLDYAIHSSREEFFKHMEELYNVYHKEDEAKSKIIVPKKEIILK